MKTILPAALLLCFIGVGAHASYNASYDKMAGPDEVAEQCDELATRLHNAVTIYLREELATRLHNAVTIYLRERSAFSQTAAEWRVEATQIATIFQTICKD